MILAVFLLAADPCDKTVCLSVLDQLYGILLCIAAVSYTHLDVYKRQLHRRAVGGIKDQHPAGESSCHPPYQFPDLLGREVIEHPGGKEHLSLIHILGVSPSDLRKHWEK